MSVTKETGDAPYTGLIILSAQNSNGTELDSREVTTDGTPTRINLEVKGRGNTQFLFTAENHISEFEVFESIIAVGECCTCRHFSSIHVLTYYFFEHCMASTWRLYCTC